MIGRVTQFSLPSMPENRNALQLSPNPEGRVHVTGGIKGYGSDSQLIFNWSEQREPPVVAPKRGGFGSRVLSATFANTRSHFDRNGVGLRY